MNIMYELKLYVAFFLKLIPGNLGCWLRSKVLPLKEIGVRSNIWDNVNIDYPSRLIVGNYSSINRNSTLHCGGSVRIGDCVLIGPNVVIYSQNHQYRNKGLLIKDQGYEYKAVEICDDVWIATGAIILPGVTIGKGAVVAAGAVVTKDVPEYSVVAGVPARLIDARS